MDRCKSRITAQPTTFTVAVCTRCRRDRDKGTGVLLDTGGSRMGYLLLRNKQPVLQEKADKAPGTRCLLVSVAQAWERLTQPALLSSQESPSSCGLYVCVWSWQSSNRLEAPPTSPLRWSRALLWAVLLRPHSRPCWWMLEAAVDPLLSFP